MIILCAFVGWKEPPHTQFRKLASGEPRGVHYTNLWETSHPEKKKLNAIVFYEYYTLLKKVVLEVPQISKEVVDTYDARINFMVDRHRIHLRPKRTKRDDWAPGWFRMTAQDIEGIIKEFDDQWK